MDGPRTKDRTKDEGPDQGPRTGPSTKHQVPSTVIGAPPMVREKLGVMFFAPFCEIRRWYARDKGETTLREVLAVMEQARHTEGVAT